MTVRLRKDGPRTDDHFRVTIQSDQGSVCSDCFEDLTTVSSSADRSIHNDLIRLQCQESQDFAEQNRLVHRPSG